MIRQAGNKKTHIKSIYLVPIVIKIKVIGEVSALIRFNYKFKRLFLLETLFIINGKSWRHISSVSNLLPNTL